MIAALETGQIVLIVLKILGLISWAWLKVFIPSFIFLGIVGVIMLLDRLRYY